ncbi:MAG: hypothetical protein OXK79_09375, partial [Chloroflexota bacterium]|nr:hypothetical protein [Chloroflexota bacterium]
MEQPKVVASEMPVRYRQASKKKKDQIIEEYMGLTGCTHHLGRGCGGAGAPRTGTATTGGSYVSGPLQGEWRRETIFVIRQLPDRCAAPDAAAADVGAAAGGEQLDAGAVRSGGVDASGQRCAAVAERFDYGSIEKDRQRERLGRFQGQRGVVHAAADFRVQAGVSPVEPQHCCVPVPSDDGPFLAVPRTGQGEADGRGVPHLDLRLHLEAVAVRCVDAERAAWGQVRAGDLCVRGGGGADLPGQVDAEFVVLD